MMITKKMTEVLENKYGFLASIILFRDFSGYIYNDNDERVAEFDSFRQLENLLKEDGLMTNENILS
jgi:hypothetical protein